MDILIPIFFGIFIFCLFLFLLYPYGRRNDEIKKRFETISNIDKKELILDEELSKPLSERIFKPIFDRLILNIKKLIPEDSKRRRESSKKTNKLKKKLRQAGIKMGTNEYQAIQIIIMAGVAVFSGTIAFALTSQTLAVLFGIILGVYIGYVVLRFDLARRITKRDETIRRQLPEVLDMLSVSVEAGLGLEQAILHVITHYKGPLVDELNITYREMTMGRTRRDAFLQLGERCEIDEVKSFVRAIVQAQEMGISIKNVLRSQAAFIRQTRRNKIEEKAMQVSVKILIPMAFFIFPVIFIVLLGPAVVTIMEQLF